MTLDPVQFYKAMADDTRLRALHLIVGELRDGVASIDAVNPADESVVAQCPITDEAMLDEAVASAHKTYLS